MNQAPRIVMLTTDPENVKAVKVLRKRSTEMQNLYVKGLQPLYNRYTTMHNLYITDSLHCETFM